MTELAALAERSFLFQYITQKHNVVNGMQILKKFLLCTFQAFWKFRHIFLLYIKKISSALLGVCAKTSRMCGLLYGFGFFSCKENCWRVEKNTILCNRIIQCHKLCRHILFALFSSHREGEPLGQYVQLWLKLSLSLFTLYQLLCWHCLS